MFGDMYVLVPTLPYFVKVINGSPIGHFIPPFPKVCQSEWMGLGPTSLSHSKGQADRGQTAYIGLKALE